MLIDVGAGKQRDKSNDRTTQGGVQCKDDGDAKAEGRNRGNESTFAPGESALFAPEGFVVPPRQL